MSRDNIMGYNPVWSAATKQLQYISTDHHSSKLLEGVAIFSNPFVGKLLVTESLRGRFVLGLSDSVPTPIFESS